MVDKKRKTWPVLNAAVQSMDDLKQLAGLLDEELKGAKRLNFVLRIHSRINKVRAEKERAELIAKVYGGKK